MRDYYGKFKQERLRKSLVDYLEELEKKPENFILNPSSYLLEARREVASFSVSSSTGRAPDS